MKRRKKEYFEAFDGGSRSDGLHKQKVKPVSSVVLFLFLLLDGWGW